MSGIKAPMLRRVGNAVLWLGAVCGLLSLAFAAATVVTGVQPLIVRSASMEPALGTGSLAIARGVDAADVSRGDVVSAIDAEGRRVTHRVMAVDTSGDKPALTLKGDTNRAPDAQPYVVDRVDRVLFDVPLLGYLASWVTGPAGMFLAGLLVAAVVASFLRRPDRPRPGRRRAQAAGAAAVLAPLGLLAATMTAPVDTDAYFTDTADFEAGTLMAHQVQSFDWAEQPCSDTGTTGLNLSYVVKDSRYNVTWDRQSTPAPTRCGSRPSPLRWVRSPRRSPTASSTSGLVNFGTNRLVGSSKLKGPATNEWLSETKREVLYTYLNVLGIGSVECGSVNVGPSLVFSKPVAGDSFASESEANAAVRAACDQLAAPCGTATDADGIKSVEYVLQRVTFFFAQCWTGDGFSYFGCGVWRPATTTPAVPAAVKTPVKWRVPLGSSSSVFDQSGLYQLSVRVTDNTNPSATTESTITFRR